MLKIKKIWLLLVIFLSSAVIALVLFQHPEKRAQPIAVLTPSAKLASIKIIGDSSCKKDTQAALDLLKSKAPSHYATVAKYISAIQCVKSGSAMLASENPPKFLVGDAERNAGTVWLAGTIVHDAGHSKLYHDYLDQYPRQQVPGEVWTGKSAEVSCLDAQYDVLTKVGGSKSQLAYIKNVINTQYYNVPYSQRWW